MENEDKVVEIARFQHPEEAQMLLSLLQSEGIDCYLRNELTTQIMPWVDMGGVRVELLESNVPRALEIMEEHGYEIPGEEEQPPHVRSFSNSKKAIVFIVLVLIVLGLLIYLNSYYKSV